MTEFTRPKGLVESSSLYVAGLGDKLGHTPAQVREALARVLDSDPPARVVVPEGKVFVFAVFESAAAAAHARDALAAAPRVLARAAPRLFCEYAVPAPPRGPPSEALVPSVRARALAAVPGLALRREFVSADEEAALLAALAPADGAWDDRTHVVRRRVRHFGVAPFDYKTRALDFTRPCEPMPACCAPVIARVARERASARAPDQLTVNEYRPGQGIASHVDTHSAFGGTLLSLSLGSGVVMEFRRAPRAGAAGAADGGGGDGAIERIWLPARSLLVLEGEARYAWQHGIPCRHTDRVDDTIVPRGTRVSLTLREAMPPGARCRCAFPEYCDRPAAADAACASEECASSPANGAVR